jgi:hypothetical protein
LTRQSRRLLLQDVPCFASFDLRSARSQHLFLAFLWGFAMTVWILNFGVRMGLCASVYVPHG